MKGLKKLPQNLQQEIESLFFQKQWIEGSKQEWQLTKPGEEIFNKIGVLAIGPSYRPMLFKMDQLLFGDMASVFSRNQRGEESHVDRLLNVLGSGYQHVRYFKDAEEEILKIFNQLPLKMQPKAIADMGCGDGTFLKQLYEAIKDKTARGKYLKQFPLSLLGIDYNRTALKATEANLQGLPFQTLLGDINDSTGLLKDLSKRGFSKGEDILHVRSFLDHNFSLDSSEAVDGSLKVLSRGEQGWYVDQHGNLLSSLQVLSRWKAHLQSWAKVLDRGGLLVLEAHSLSLQESYLQLEVSENFYFDTLHSFSHQYLISAESFVILAANVGLFSKVPLKRYPKTLNFCRITLNHFEKREYIIRHAAVKDLEMLYQLEKLCWKKELQIPDSQIQSRIEKYPQGQFVLEKGGDVLGVIYSQRIESAEELDGETFLTVHRLHNEQGEVVQFLALNVHPEVQDLRLGDQLLEFMLQRCSVMNGVTSVVGVTLCTDYDSGGDLSFREYIHYRNEHGKIHDSMLSFHEAHGATIERELEGYRPKDTTNEGFGPLIRYDIFAQRIPFGLREKPVDCGLDRKSAATTLSSPEKPSQKEITKFLQEKVNTLLGEDKKAFDMERPLMEMGLDSADLLELQNQIIENLEVSLDSAFFFQYNTIGKVVLYLVTTLGISKEDEVQEVANESNLSNFANISKIPQSAITDSADIAIIGISCKLPGGLETPSELWELLQTGGSATGKLPPGRFQWPESVSAETYPGIDKGGFIRDAGSFDADFFRISPKEAEMMDPQQRILLELSWSCLEDAGVLPGDLKGSDTGVFIGASGSDYSKLLQDAGVEVEAHYGTGSSLAVLANRISYFFDFSGPSILIDTGCSSSLVAVHTAVQSLRRGECSMALVGGVNLICHSANSMAYYKAGMLSPDGRCKTFDASANGYVRSEGAVMLVLKPAKKAMGERDFIYGVIKGSAINHGGLSAGLTVPNPQKQTELLMSAWEDAGIKQKSLSYLEAHGTGTALGDPIEVQGIKQAFADFSKLNKTSFCGIGSLKSNLGHLEAAAGIAGLLKIVLSMQWNQLPSSIHFENLNPKIELKDSPLYIVSRHRAWNVSKDQLRFAGVSSFGSGGTNAHVVLQEYPQPEKSEIAQDFYLFVLSASNMELLRAYATKILAWIEKNQEQVSFSDFIYTFQMGRTAMQERLAIKVISFADLQSKLELWFNGEEGIKNCWQENSRNAHSKFNNLLKGKSGQQVIDSALDKKDFVQLATLWILGFEIDWKFLHETIPKRIPAPSYPFSNNHFWIAGEKQQEILGDTKNRWTLHPLLHENTSDLSVQRFTSTFTGKEFFLDDHKVKGRKVLPGVVCLEMARAAVAKACGPTEERMSIQLKNIVWARPIVINDSVQKVHIELYGKDDGQIQYEVYTESDNEEAAVVHFQGVADFKEKAETHTLDIKNLRLQMNQGTLSAEECYESFKKLGIDYGKRFHGIRVIHQGEDQLLARLSLPHSVKDTQNGYVLHPSLMDSTLQSSIGLMINHGELQEGSESQLKLSLPFALESLEILDSCPLEMYAWIRHSGGKALSDKVQKLDIDICNEQGKVSVKMKGFSSRVLEGEIGASKANDSIGISLITPVWNESAVMSSEPQPSKDTIISGLDPKTLEEKTEQYLKKQFSSQLKLPFSKIDAQAPFEKYGIDSIFAMDLTNQLEKIFGSLPKTLFFEYQTIAELTRYFMQSYKAKLASLFQEDSGFLKETKPMVLPANASALKTKQKRRRGIFSGLQTFGARATASSPLEIAIIGLSGRYPESANVLEYWKNLRDGKDCIIEVPEDRWNWRENFSEDYDGKDGPLYSKWGGFIKGVDEFDPLFFNISPREAEMTDPQERLFLEHAWMAMEDAGYTRETLQIVQEKDHAGQVGVYVGVMYGEYQLFGAEESLKGNRMAFASSLASIANRVSYVFNLHGPSMTVDTMCSSSLTSIHLACQDLKQGRTNLALAGGVNISIHPNKYLMLSAGQFISTKGHCESFGEGGDGYIPGEGVGVVLLKRLDEAIRDGDQIYGIIQGSAINHGGKTNGYTVPNPNAQRNAIERALSESGIDPRRISYIEAHGTGTKLGDPIEVTALSQAFEKYTQEKGFCLIGSAKSNIGHCEGAAGVAGLTKVLLQMKYGQITPSLHSSTLNPNIDFKNTPFVVNQERTNWDCPIVDGEELPRIAGISSFGAGGSNAHLIIKEYQDFQRKNKAAITVSSFPVIVPFSARTKEQLFELVRNILHFLKEHAFVLGSKSAICKDATQQEQSNQNEHFDTSSLDIINISFTLQVGREAMEERVGFIVTSIHELEEKLESYLSGNQEIEECYQGQVKRNKETLGVFATNEELQEAIEKWIQRRKLSNILDLWVKGLVLDWNKLYSESKPKRISLPTYPFARERYWISKTHSKGTIATAEGSISVIHPLLHENTSDLSEQRFTTSFTGKEFFLTHHQVKGVKVFPGVGYLEMVRAAVEKASGVIEEGTTIHLKNIVWAQPIVIDGIARKVHVGLYDEESGLIQYEVYTESDNEEVSAVHFHGLAELREKEDVLALDIQNLQSQMNQGTLNAKNCYQAFKRMGINYG